MEELKAALFDMDGVIVDTEPIYDLFWEKAGERYNAGISNFASAIKGVTLPNIIEKYFSACSPELIRQLIGEVDHYESVMPLPQVPGSVNFLRLLQGRGVKMGLVTSSGREKVERTIALYHLEEIFGSVVASDRIAEGKPNPLCYLLAARDLEVDPANCIVFEDSYNGIRAGNAAGMRVIGLSTTNPAESIAAMTHDVIPNFEGVTAERYAAWCK
ncbi:MAG: HAD family phosphatase [Tannerellaceae bacterium]|jgi:HAD superfamily hydrolase (TIGR01509 family)|nr:HAD family phosphatase [Tannerellaceae bacterium]